MRVLMLGWEFPPFISGGLGAACYGLTRALAGAGTEVLFVLPRPAASSPTSHVRRLTDRPDPGEGIHAYQREEFPRVTFWAIDAELRPYDRPAAVPAEAAPPAESASPESNTAQSTSTAGQSAGAGGSSGNRGVDLFEEVERYARLACRVAARESFDLVHAHDWMTWPAGIAVARMSGKPLVAHVHSTEFDRAADGLDPRIFEIEQRGLSSADAVIAVSYLTKNLVVRRYGVDPSKVYVVYNAAHPNGEVFDDKIPPIRKSEKIVLFLGRITAQKGPECFLAAARRVLQVEENVRFIMAGSGDMVRRTIELADELGLADRVILAGFLQGRDLERAFRSADVFVMPSVSEPFGIAALEALGHNVPVIVSRQSGAAEVLTHVLKADFWDIDDMAGKIVAVLRHPPLHAALRERGRFEVRRLTWTDAARRCREVHDLVTNR